MEHALSKTLRIPIKRNSLVFVALVAALLIAGCAGIGKPEYNVENFLLSYPVPSLSKQDQLPMSVKFNRFSIAAAYNSTGMIFRSDAYSLDAFNYSRWAVNPADMIADSLVRDVRGIGLFKAVFSRYDQDEARFLISGGIEEFYLRIDKSNKTAVICIAVSLTDIREKETGKKMMFQKKYTREEPLQDPSPRGYCQAASLALQGISREITNDIYAAVQSKISRP